MNPDYRISSHARQVAEATHARLQAFMTPLMTILDRQLDSRLVRTMLQTMTAMLMLRQRATGLLLSELGAWITGPAHAPAGTKRIQRLLASIKWSPSVIERWLWTHATDVIQTHGSPSAPLPLLIWDSSVLESPESPRLPDLCAVRSTKAARLKRIKPGYFNPPTGRPICVPGIHWLGLLVVAAGRPPVVAAMRWWTRRGVSASTKAEQETQLFAEAHAAWGQQVRHVWDRGYASAAWLTQALEANCRFVLRWKKGNKLLNRAGDEQKAWQIARGKRSWGYRMLYDTHTRTERKYGVVAMNVTHPAHARPMWLVVARPGKGREPWYLLTSDPIHTEAAAWDIVYAYAKRWQIEQTWRSGKSELAMESPRLWTLERRRKLLSLVTLVYAFLLSLLADSAMTVRHALLRYGCHRTGRHVADAHVPLYRIRAAISHLWMALIAARAWPLQNSG